MNNNFLLVNGLITYVDSNGNLIRLEKKDKLDGELTKIKQESKDRRTFLKILNQLTALMEEEPIREILDFIKSKNKSFTISELLKIIEIKFSCTLHKYGIEIEK